MPFLRPYNTLLVTGTTGIRIPIIKRASVDFAVGADWTPVAGDVTIKTGAGASANVTNLPTAIARGNTAEWEFILTAAELSGKTVTVLISDAATKVIEDQCFIVETYGNASAMYAADLSLANFPANVTQLLGTAWLTPGTAGTPDVNTKLVGGQTASAAGAVTFPGTIASTTNITAGTITTVTTTTNLTNLPAITANWLTAAGTAADFGTEVASAVWDMDATAHQTQGTFGQAIGDPVADTNTIYKATVTDATGATVGVDVVDLKTQIGTAGAGLSNIGTIATVTNLTNLPAITANWLTAAGVAADVTTEIWAGSTAPTAAAIASAVWTDTTAGDFTAPLSIGKTIVNGVALGTGLTINSYTGNTVQTGDSFARIGAAGAGLTAIDLPDQTMNITGNITGNLSGSVGSVTGAVGSVTGNVGGNVVGSVASVTAAVAITSNIKQNQALTAFTFHMTDSTTHAPATGLAVTVTRSIDGGAFAAGTLSAVTEVSNGIYKVNFGAGDLNGKVIILQATAAASDTTFERIVTQV